MKTPMWTMLRMLRQRYLNLYMINIVLSHSTGEKGNNECLWISKGLQNACKMKKMYCLKVS